MSQRQPVRRIKSEDAMRKIGARGFEPRPAYETAGSPASLVHSGALGLHLLLHSDGLNPITSSAFGQVERLVGIGQQ
jgi:hypothetical protein